MPVPSEKIPVFFRKVPTHLWVAGSAWASRLVSAIIGLFSIRILIQGLGTEQYAVYAILGGLQAWYLLTDLGIGTSLQNHISERRAQDLSYEDYVAITGVIAFVLLALSISSLYLASPFLAPLILKGAHHLSEFDKNRHFFLIGLISIATCFGSISYRIWYAEQKGYLANIVPAIASVTSFIGVIIVSRGSFDNKLYWSLVAAYGPAGLLPIVIFLRRITGNILRIRSIKLNILWPLVKRGLKFWMVSILAAGVLQMDYVIMARYLPAGEIVVYNLTSKMFGLVYFVYTAILGAVWPVCAEAISRDEWTNVTKLLTRYIVLGVVMIIIFTIMLSLYLQPIINVLSPREIVSIPVQFIVLFGLYQIIRAYTDTYGMALQSMSYIRPFLMFMPFQVVINVGVQVMTVSRYGIYGVIGGLILSFLLTATWVIPFSFFTTKKSMLFKKQSERYV